MKHPLIALLSDFGEDDFFVASVKGVITSINPSARIIDITHQVSSYDILGGSFILFACYRFFPSGTVFLVVVDPGVGSSRKIILVETRDYYFIGPDNGVLSYVLDSEEVKEIREVRSRKYFLKELTMTFEARDKMAPVAGWLSKGVSAKEFGPKIRTWIKLKRIKPQQRENTIEGSVVYVDKFGNLITNIPLKMVNQLPGKRSRRNISLFVKNRQINSFVENYSCGKKGELFFLAGSLGLIEVAARECSAKEIVKAQVGDSVKLALREG